MSDAPRPKVRRRRKRVRDEAPTRAGPGPGEVLGGRYRLERVLSERAAGSLFAATDTVLQRFEVAVKLLPAEVAASAAGVKRVRRVALGAQKITHPHVVRLHSFEQDGAHAFLVQELLTGASLEEELAEHERLGPEAVLELAEQVGGGLDAVHSMQLVHRSLSPANLVRAEPGGPWKVTDVAVGDELRDTLARVTGTETAASLLYTAPELFAGGDEGPASDQYALAAVLYEALRGRPPFHGPGLSHQIQSLDPAPLEGEAAALSPALLQALSKDPGQRFEDCAALARALREAHQASRAAAVPPGPPGTPAEPLPTAPPAGSPPRTPGSGALTRGLVAAALVGLGSALVLLPSGPGPARAPRGGATPPLGAPAAPGGQGSAPTRAEGDPGQATTPPRPSTSFGEAAEASAAEASPPPRASTDPAPPGGPASLAAAAPPGGPASPGAAAPPGGPALPAVAAPLPSPTTPTPALSSEAPAAASAATPAPTPEAPAPATASASRTRVVLTSKPLGAKVYRQRPGRADEYLGKTWKPLEVQVEPGEVRFWFHHPGHPHLTGKQAVQTVTGAGPHRISVELPRGEATLTLALTPAEATATLAGRPLVSGANTVPAGPATLEVRAPGHRTQREDLDLAAGASLTRQVQLTRAEVPVQVVGYPEQAPDVPAGHWAQDEYRAAAAWIPHPDGKFQGHALATVPDVSCALVRILDHLGKAPGLDEVRPEAQGVSWQGQCLGRAVTAHVIPVDTLPPPDDPVVPRRTLAGWLSRLLARVGAIPELAPFVLKDVASSDPAYSEIAVVTSARLFPSYQARFHPDTALTRFQLAIVLANLRRFLETRGVWK